MDLSAANFWPSPGRSLVCSLFHTLFERCVQTITQLAMLHGSAFSNLGAGLLGYRLDPLTEAIISSMFKADDFKFETSHFIRLAFL